MPNHNNTTRRYCDERRAKPTVYRAAPDAPPQIVGYAAVFYNPDNPATVYRLYDDLEERILPGAFDETLTKDDCAALFNHDPNKVLGRRSAGTLVLSVDEFGLKYSITPPDTETARELLTLLERRDIQGSSFGFDPLDENYQQETKDGKPLYIRNITRVELYDVGPVTHPAYTATTAEARSVRERALTQINPGQMQAAKRAAFLNQCTLEELQNA